MMPSTAKRLLAVPGTFTYFAAFFTSFVLNTYHLAPVKQMEEYVPQMIPTINGRANSLMEDTPNTSNAATMKNVVREVKILLDNVCEILLFTRSCNSSLSFYPAGSHEYGQR